MVGSPVQDFAWGIRLCAKPGHTEMNQSGAVIPILGSDNQLRHPLTPCDTQYKQLMTPSDTQSRHPMTQ